MPRGTPRVSPPLSAQFLCWRKTFGGIPSVLIQVLFSLPICLLQGGVAKSYEGLKTPFCYDGQKLAYPLPLPTNPAKIAGNGWDSDTRTTGPTHPTVAPSWWASATATGSSPHSGLPLLHSRSTGWC